MPVILRDPRSAVAIARQLEEDGFFVGAMQASFGSLGSSRLRITVTAVHDVQDVSDLIDALKKAAAAVIV